MKTIIELKSQSENRKAKVQNLKFLVLSFCFALCVLSFTFTSISFAQHEGHQMQPAVKEEAKTKVKKAAPGKAVYYCPMHPTYASDRPGDCPICNMKLVKKEEAEETEKGARLTADEKEGGFYVSPEKQQLIGVKTDKVIYRPLNKIIRTVGRVDFDPELYKDQQEYIEPLKT